MVLPRSGQILVILNLDFNLDNYFG